MKTPESIEKKKRGERNSVDVKYMITSMGYAECVQKLYEEPNRKWTSQDVLNLLESKSVPCL